MTETMKQANRLARAAWFSIQHANYFAGGIFLSTILAEAERCGFARRNGDTVKTIPGKIRLVRAAFRILCYSNPTPYPECFDANHRSCPIPRV